MPNRFEYIQANLKGNAQKKTSAGVCKAAEAIAPLQNNWTAFIGGGAVPLRTWKDAAGTTHMQGGANVGATPPVISGGYYQVTTIAPAFRPASSIVFPVTYYDASATPTGIASFGVVETTGIVKINTNGVTPANGDFVIFESKWVV